MDLYNNVESYTIIALAVLVIVLFLLNRHKREKIASIIEKAEADVSAARTACENEKNALISKHKSETDLIIEKCNNDISTLRQECLKRIQQEKEKIENRKEMLAAMEEKELLASVMIALDGYAGRFERIEKQLTEDQIADKVSKLVQSVNEKLNSISDSLSEQIDTMNSSLDETLNDSDLRQRIDSISSELEDLDSNVEEIRNSVCDKYSFDSLASKIDSVTDNVESIKRSVDQIYSSVCDRI